MVYYNPIISYKLPHFGGAFLIILITLYNIGMIYLEKDTVNIFVLTLAEVTTIPNPYYLFEFQDEFNTTATLIYWVGTDTSAYPSRFNLFTLDAAFKYGSIDEMISALTARYGRIDAQMAALLKLMKSYFEDMAEK